MKTLPYLPNHSQRLQHSQHTHINRISKCLRALALVSGLAAAATLSAQTIVNVPITSPGFEDISSGKPTGWTHDVNSNSTGKLWDATKTGEEGMVHSGRYAYGMTVPSITSNYATIRQGSTGRFDVEPGTTYTLSLWARGDNLDLVTDKFDVVIQWYKADNSTTAGSNRSTLLSFDANGAWQQFSITGTFVAPAEAAKGAIYIYARRGQGGTSTSTTATYTFDDLALTYQTASVPEPASVAVWLGAFTVLAGLLAARRKRR